MLFTLTLIVSRWKIIFKKISVSVVFLRSYSKLGFTAEFYMWVANLKATCIIWSALRTMAAYFISLERGNAPSTTSLTNYWYFCDTVRTCNWLMTRAYIFYPGILINSEAHSRDFCAGRLAQCETSRNSLQRL